MDKTTTPRLLGNLKDKWARSPRVLFMPRRRFFVKRGLQFRLVMGAALSAVLSFLLVLVDYYFSFGRNAGWDLDMLTVFLKSQKLPVVQLVIFVVILVFLTLKYSLRVAGPLVNLERSLFRVAEGDLTTRLQLRPRDELKDIRDAFNRTLCRLNEHVAADRARSVEILKIMELLGSSKNLDTAEVAEINRAVALLRTVTASFKV